jgi:hypothetical protein
MVALWGRKERERGGGSDLGEWDVCIIVLKAEGNAMQGCLLLL